MVLINVNNNREINIDIFILDTIDSIRNKIAIALDTLPKYIYINPEIKLTEIDHLDIISLEEIVKKYSEDWEKYLEHAMKNFKSIGIENLLKLWLIDKPDDEIEVYKMIIRKFGDIQINSEIFNDISNFQRYYINQKEKQYEKINKQNDDIIMFEDLERIIHSQFYTESKRIELIFDDDNLSLLEIFNNIKLDEYVPFAVNVNDNLLKIYNNFIPDEDWGDNEKYDENYLLLRIMNLHKNKLKNDIDEDYTEVDISQQNQTFKILMDVFLNDKMFISKKKLFSRMLKSIGIITDTYESLSDLNIIEKELEIKGVYFFPNFYFNQFIFADLCMNDNIFSQFLKIDESVKPHKESLYNLDSVYIYFNYNNIEIRANVSTRIMDNKDPDLKYIKNKKLIPINSKYVKVKIVKAQNIDHINYFIDIFSKLMTYYNNKKEGIIYDYRVLLKDKTFGQEKIIKQSKIKNFLKRTNPDLFMSDYSKYCQFPPIIIQEDKVNDYDPDSVITFPKTKEEGPQYIYACDTEKGRHPRTGYIYPGLRENKLPNQDKYPFIPCCYLTPYGKNRKMLENYMKDNLVIDNSKKNINERLITTNKMLPTRQHVGTLPDDLKQILNNISIYYNSYRKGMLRSVNSLLECILVGISQVNTEIFNQLNIAGNSDDSMNQLLEKYRMSLLDDNLLSVCKQQNYDINIDIIKQKLINKETYLDPRIYIKLLENKFEVNIYVFNINKDNEIDIVILRHTHGYLNYHTFYNTSIVVYENQGSYTDKLEYPQCELIYFQNKENVEKTYYYLPNKNWEEMEELYNIRTYIRKQFMKMTETYQLNKLLSRIILPYDDKNKQIIINSQYIDNYGKTRFIEVIYKDQELYILTSPLPPLPVKIKDIEYFQKTNDFNLTQEFIETYNMKITSQYVKENKTYEISCRVNSNKLSVNQIKYTFLVNTNIIKDVKFTINNEIIISNESKITEFNKNKKIARYLSEYIYYEFSKYISSKIDNLMSKQNDYNLEEYILPFFNEKVENIIDFEYGYIQQYFTTTGGIMRNNKIIIGGKNPEETRKRLIYVLSLKIKQYPEYILKYSLQTYMNNYFVDITDYSIYSNQIILQGQQSLNKWIQMKTFDNKIKQEVIPGYKNPYFYKNSEMLDNKIYLIQENENLNSALYKNKIWNEKKYNIQNTNINYDIKNEKYNLYSYINKNNYNEYYVEGLDIQQKGKKDSVNNNIIGYKDQENDTKYISVFKL